MYVWSQPSTNHISNCCFKIKQRNIHLIPSLQHLYFLTLSMFQTVCHLSYLLSFIRVSLLLMLVWNWCFPLLRRIQEGLGHLWKRSANCSYPEQPADFYTASKDKLLPDCKSERLSEQKTCTLFYKWLLSIKCLKPEPEHWFMTSWLHSSYHSFQV